MKDNSKNQKKEIESLEKKVAELEELVSCLQKEKDETFEKLQRLGADYANFQKRAPKQIADSVAYEKEKFVKALLGAIDNFEHALANSDKAEDLKSFVQGIQIVHDEIINTFKSLGVERIESVGQTFNPSMHEALMQRSEEGKTPGEILEEYQKGYKLNDRVIRPAKVIVNKVAPLQSEQQQVSEEQPDEDQQENDSENEQE